ncbi:IS607 family transposase [Candidatus Marsarchaeota G2 archaeon ECH_B_2]|uniref:IS607 family transposase n=3 Tax=Candidatus Marsarchaeota group 2 TaxID=2203771 RepID=A0A2R6B5C0_9ARCH|nr:MAG: IS607 family transposase [Candidatus Marsarchaeota G2 archaeon ECH_B_2]PSN93857.1 MAG: IS607 family transposase [Candidatus Marsarchaeota G2 archaeon ECH_B_2]PSN98200.1 MAG: IS607 family transposase [Candidatus Marsarchaeota G2 archaeon ECH_B_3]PSO01227.1 MAG: IS607 family transposase [Candidatus Marsarchaeota G2 archaeon ECH_B_1]
MPERLYTLKEACLLLGLHPRTIQKWDKQGKIRVVRTPGGRRRIPESEIRRLQGEKGIRSVIGYARVSSNTQKDDLERQVEYLRQRGVREVVTDIGSGLNEKRRGFLRLLDRVLHNEVDKVVVLYEDRLTRFGFDTLKKVFEAHGTTIEVLNQADVKPPQQELVEDLITIISRFSGKLYGMRSHKQKEVVKRAKELFAQA